MQQPQIGMPDDPVEISRLHISFKRNSGLSGHFARRCGGHILHHAVFPFKPNRIRRPSMQIFLLALVALHTGVDVFPLLRRLLKRCVRVVFFLLKLRYEGDTLVEAVLNGAPVAL